MSSTWETLKGPGQQCRRACGDPGGGGRTAAPPCEFMVRELNLCPAGGTRCSSMGPEGLDSGVGLQERCVWCQIPEISP